MISTRAHAQFPSPLHKYGASPFVRDLFLELQTMTVAVARACSFTRDNDRSISIAQNEPFPAEAVKMSISSMAQKAINLHVEVKNGVTPFKQCLGTKCENAGQGACTDTVCNCFTWNKLDPLLCTSTPASAFKWETHVEPIKAVHFLPNKRKYFHYALNARQYDCPCVSGGLARGIPSQDLIITIGRSAGQWPDPELYAGTLLHELGHNLGLPHGSVDYDNFKVLKFAGLQWGLIALTSTVLRARQPNHISIMNYLYPNGVRKIVGGKERSELLYSELDCDNIPPKTFDEAKGIKCTRPSAESPLYTPTEPTAAPAVYLASLDGDKFFPINEPADVNGDSKHTVIQVSACSPNRHETRV
jgi:hypothetical protein